MSAFQPSGRSMKLAYADDSTDYSMAIDQPAPTHLCVVNIDAANVVAFNAGFTDGDVDAIIPTSGQNGAGLIIGAGETLFFALDTTRASESGNLFVSIAGVSPTGNVYVTPGQYEPQVFKGY